MKTRLAPFLLFFLVFKGLGFTAEPKQLLGNQRVSLRPGGPQVEVKVDTTGDLRITTSQGKLALFLPADSWLAFDEGDVRSWDPSALEFVDVTFDGLADLKVLVARGAYNFIYQYWSWDPSLQQFRPLAGLEQVTNPELDLKAKTLVSFHKGRGYGDLWVRREFRWVGTTWAAREETERQLVDENVEGSGYLLIHRRVQKGVWVEVSREPSDDELTSPP